MTTAADLAGVLFVAVAAMFAGSILFALLFLPRIIAAVRAQYDDDERAAAEASGDAAYLHRDVSWQDGDYADYVAAFEEDARNADAWDAAVEQAMRVGNSARPLAESETAQRVWDVLAANEAARADWSELHKWGRP